jgi:hypothetical protein
MDYDKGRYPYLICDGFSSLAGERNCATFLIVPSASIGYHGVATKMPIWYVVEKSLAQHSDYYLPEPWTLKLKSCINPMRKRK